MSTPTNPTWLSLLHIPTAQHALQPNFSVLLQACAFTAATIPVIVSAFQRRSFFSFPFEEWNGDRRTPGAPCALSPLTFQPYLSVRTPCGPRGSTRLQHALIATDTLGVSGLGGGCDYPPLPHSPRLTRRYVVPGYSLTRLTACPTAHSR